MILFFATMRNSVSSVLLWFLLSFVWWICPCSNMKSAFAFALNFVLHSSCCDRFSFNAINHIHYNGLLVIVQCFSVYQSPEALSLHFEKIPDITVRWLLVIVECFGFFNGTPVFTFLNSSLSLIMCMCSSKLTQGYLRGLNYETNKLWRHLLLLCSSW